MDEATAAALAALAISIFAMLIAAAQALQQYFITGQLIRLCDSVVFGDLPGQGRRIWRTSQFRFRVVYRVPQIGLPPELWPSSAAQSYVQIDEPLPYLSAERVTGKQDGGIAAALLPVSRFLSSGKEDSLLGQELGEASWASFCRVVYHSCHASIGYSFFEGDADRCPDDIPTVPMQLSLRDAVVMALMVGMECTGASFDRGSISMQGAAGTITSSQHPVLGPTIHFTPRKHSGRQGIGGTGTIYKEWLWRAMGNCIVAGRHYNWRRRRWLQHELPERPPSPYELIIRRHGEYTDETSSTSSESTAPMSVRSLRNPKDGIWQLVSSPSPQQPLIGIKDAAMFDEDAQPDFSPPMFSWELQKPRDPGEKVRPTYTRIAKRYISIETLVKFGYEFGDDPQDPGYVLIRRWVGETEQDVIFKHTRQLRDARLRQQRRENGDDLSEVIVIEDMSTPTASDGGDDSSEEIVDEDTSTPTASDGGVSAPSRLEHVHVHDFARGLQDPIVVRSKSLEGLAGDILADGKCGSGASSSGDQRLNVTGRGSGKLNMASEVPKDTIVLEPQEKLDEQEKPSSSAGEQDDMSDISESMETTSVSREDSNRSPNSRQGSLLIFEGRGRDEEPMSERQSGRGSRQRDRPVRRDEGKPPPPNALLNHRIGDMDWYWLSQTDIIPGFWATPWRSFEGLNAQTCIGAVAVMIESVTQSIGGPAHVRYLEFSSSPRNAAIGDTLDALMSGTCTYPAYAFRAHGGVVCAGTYAAIRHPAFRQAIPAVDLLDSFEHQIDHALAKSQTACERRLVELMRLDAWLSLVGRMPEIEWGRSGVLTFTPRLVQDLMIDFQWRFFDADLSSESDRANVYKTTGNIVIASLQDKGLTAAEVLYVLVAVLRTVKVGQAILAGADTRMLIEIFEKDVQVHLV